MSYVLILSNSSTDLILEPVPIEIPLVFIYDNQTLVDKHRSTHNGTFSI